MHGIPGLEKERAARCGALSILAVARRFQRSVALIRCEREQSSAKDAKVAKKPLFSVVGFGVLCVLRGQTLFARLESGAVFPGSG
ncbi:MAG: hypothetical protein ACREP0_08765, partial [Rhodanobacteraceae bacterium]